jgi:hypothetical protein
LLVRYDGERRIGDRIMVEVRVACRNCETDRRESEMIREITSFYLSILDDEAVYRICKVHTSLLLQETGKERKIFMVKTSSFDDFEACCVLLAVRFQLFSLPGV